MISIIAQNNILQAEYPELLKYDDWHKTIAFERAGLVFVFNWHVNLSPTNYEIPVTKAGKYKIILNSDLSRFGGFDRVNLQ